MKPTFIQPCFIRKNTQDLRRKLEKLGYYKHPSSLVDKTDKQFLFCNRGMFAELPIGYTEEVYNSIDCGTNEDLFLAVAALREDSDEHQWFTDGKNWLKCQYESIEDERQEARECHYYGATVYNCHKASVEELIEHFKKD